MTGVLSSLTGIQTLRRPDIHRSPRPCKTNSWRFQRQDVQTFASTVSPLLAVWTPEHPDVWTSMTKNRLGVET